ncbi:hypothetical protein CCAX7_46400 [Capsulimonas corticalis]|uniref:Uncharacterized protein n=2 Tax=Capsulimonas corticalis TaxID=2219043 RepID=A0A402D526_9BACT|nr:hypothetical protein CCAX7_46400 [Capsulimonas corticalis]
MIPMTANADCIPPPAPSGVVATPGDGAITITWIPVNGATAGYGISYGTTPADAFQKPYSGGSAGASYTFSGLKNNITYYFAVYANKDVCSSDPSAMVSQTLTLDPPTGVTAGAGPTDDSVVVKWNPVSGADNYYVNYGTTPIAASAHPNGPFDLGSTGSSLTVGGLPSGVYFFQTYSANLGGVTPGPMVRALVGHPQVPPYADARPKDAPPCDCGPSAYDPVDLTNGTEDYDPAPDLVAYNPSGPKASFQRQYSSDRALTGAASPGLSAGWTHGYDITIQPSQLSSWGSLKMIYPNGASETLVPNLDGSGQPTGTFAAVSGAPYYVTGVAGSTAGQWSSLTLVNSDRSQWRFVPFGGLFVLGRITDRMGHSIVLNWNGDRTLTSVADASSGAALLTFTYNSGNLSSVADNSGRKVTYGWTTPASVALNCLTTVSQVSDAGASPQPAHWTYGYSAFFGQPLLGNITVPSPTGHGTSTSHIVYDSKGAVAALVDANGNIRSYKASAGATMVEVKNSNKTLSQMTYSYDGLGRSNGIKDVYNRTATIEYLDPTNPSKFTKQTDLAGKITTMTYDAFGNITGVTNPRGVATSFSYDYSLFPLGRLLSVQPGTNFSSPRMPSSISYYEPSGLISSVTEPAPGSIGSGSSVSTNFNYDALGNVTRIVTPGTDATLISGVDQGIVTTLNYATDGSYTQAPAVGQPIVITDNLGKATHLRYDSHGNLIAMTDAIGNETDISYNIADQPTTTTLPATGQTGSGRAKQVAAYLFPGGPIVSLTSYDESGNQVRQIVYNYGLEGELLSVTGSPDPVSYTYDALYRLKSLTDAGGHTTRYYYHPTGELATVIYPGGETVQLPSYDAVGNVLMRVDGRGVETDYQYNDAEQRLTDIIYPLDTAKSVHYGYDSYGRRSSMADGTGATTYSYDDRDLLQWATTSYAGLASQSVLYTYQPNASRKSMGTPAGTFQYSYDVDGQLHKVTNPFGEVDTLSYLDNGWVSSHQHGNGVLTNFAYNALGQLSSLSHQSPTGDLLSKFDSLMYDGLGNRTSMTATIPGHTGYSGTTTFTYDALSRLVQEQSTRNGGYTNLFSYDAAGNPLTMRGGSNSFNANNQNAGFTYDLNGNPTAYRGVSLSYDEENRLVTNGH